MAHGAVSGALSDVPRGPSGENRWAQERPLAIRKVEVLTKDPACGVRVELRIDLSAGYESPFDPDGIAVDAMVRAPSGKEITVPGFFYQNYERRTTGSHYGRNSSRAVGPDSTPSGRRERITTI